MLAYTYTGPGTFELLEKPKPVLQEAQDAIVKITLSSICTSDLHIKHGSVPRAVPGITVGHEMVGIVESTGPDVFAVKPGDRVTVNVETFCGSCFFCQNGFVNNCTDPNGGWALGCRIDGAQAEYILRDYEGYVSVFASDADRRPLQVTGIEVAGLRRADQELLRGGITVGSQEQLLLLLEDLGS